MAASFAVSCTINNLPSSNCQPLFCGVTSTKGYSRMSSFAAGSQRQVGAGICTGPKTKTTPVITKVPKLQTGI